MIYDKRAAANLIGCLMVKPELLNNIEKYVFDKNDFALPLHKIIFSTISNLYCSGAEKLSINDIHDYLSKYPELYNTFINNKGSEFLIAAEESAEIANFDIYYDRVKKLSLLRRLKEDGFDVKDWYIEDIYEISKRQHMEKKLEEASLNEILLSIHGKLAEVESDFTSKKSFMFGEAHDGIDELIEELKTTPEIGLPLQGNIFNTVVRGARRGKLLLYSGATGEGKSRIAIGNAAHLAYPIRFNTKLKQWENTGSNQKVLFISTEQKIDEIQTILIAYISGINEDKILNGDYTSEEEIRVGQTKKIMKAFKDNFYIYLMPDPNIEQINSNVRRMAINNQIDAVFYDYIHTSTSLIAEYSGAKLREDVALLLVANALKNLANELNIFVWSGSQYNGQGMEAEFVDESCLRGARSLADKVDVGCGLKTPDKKMLKQISHLLKSGMSEPNMYIDIYKNRRSKYKRCRIWMQVDLGCARIEDLFITDIHGNQLPMDLLYMADSTAKFNPDEVLNAELNQIQTELRQPITLDENDVAEAIQSSPSIESQQDPPEVETQSTPKFDIDSITL